MQRPFNFCAGPATIPLEVLKSVQAELTDWHDGMSVMEVSHRSDAFMQLVHDCEKDIRELLDIPSNYHVLFMQGGATAQFSAIPLNLLGDNGKADYLETGVWSTKALEEAKRYGDIHVAASGKSSKFTTVPDFSTWTLRDDAAYLHYTPNETIHGVEFNYVPQVDVPLVADMSSCILSRTIDVQDYALIYAGAQKNMGPSGITLVIVREDLIGRAHSMTPAILNYQNFSTTESIYNTPPTFSWYLCAKMYRWMIEQGGVAKIEQRNIEKANKLYQYIDASGFYSNPVDPVYRSRMNVPFLLADTTLEKPFLAEADQAGLKQLEGHRSVGGMRASIYNAMPMEGVDALIAFMQDFAKRHG